MQPAFPDTTETLLRVRQQLILAQVRIMELEDVRDEISSKLGDTSSLLTAAQKLADQKIDESAHLEKVRADLQAQYEHMRHMQHVTNEALNQTRAQVEAVGKDRHQLQRDTATLQSQVAQLLENIHRLNANLGDAQKNARSQTAQIAQFETELGRMRTTRSWRWTGWLRAIGDKFGGGKA